MSLEWVRSRYGVPARRGVRVIFDGRPGRITSARGGHLRILLDGSKHPVPVHPRWRVTYLDAQGRAIGPEPVQ